MEFMHCTRDKSLFLKVASSRLPRAAHPRESKVCHMNVVDWQKAFFFELLLLFCLAFLRERLFGNDFHESRVDATLRR